LKKNIEISEVFTIDTDENRCALLFCLQLQHQLDNAKMLFLTANNFDLVHDNLERVKPYLPYFDVLKVRTKYLFMKDSWLDLHAQYGTRALSNELSSLVEHSQEDIFFFHRIDLFFDKVFTKELEDLLIAFIKDIRYYHKKVIVSYNSKTVSGKAFETLFVDRRDISYHIQEDKSDVDGDCYTTIKTYNKFLTKQSSEIILITDKNEIINMHKTIFENQKDINFKDLTLEAVKNDLNLIGKSTDIVIYNDAKSLIEPNIIEGIKKSAPFAKIFQLSDQKFLRKTDRTNAKELGIDYLATKNFDIEEYIVSIESVIENTFYTKKLKHFYTLEKQKEIDLEELKHHVMALKENNILFALLSVKKEDIDASDITTLLREHDYVFHDSSHNRVVFVLLNILRDNAQNILAKRLNIKKRFITIYHDITVD